MRSKIKDKVFTMYPSLKNYNGYQMIDDALLNELISFSIIAIVVIALAFFGNYYVNKLDKKSEES